MILMFEKKLAARSFALIHMVVISNAAIFLTMSWYVIQR